MTCAIYARYSMDNQSDRSIEDQFRLCERFAAGHGLSVIERYEDRAVSGTKLAQRLGLQRLLRDAKTGLFRVLVIEHGDRLSRHAGDIHHLREALEFAGVRILQVDGGELDQTKAAISGLVSSLTLASIKQKILRGMSGRVAQGLSMGGRAFGYEAVKGEPGRLEIVPEQAGIVRRIFTDYAGGDSARTIAGRLNREGVSGPRGPRWSASAIGGWGQRGTGIIGNEIYVGRLVWNKVHMVVNPETRQRVSRPNPPDQWIRTPRPELAIIDEALWAAAQARRKGRRDRPTARPPKHLLSGLLKCPMCGGSLTVHDRSRHGRVSLSCSIWKETRCCSNTRRYDMKRIEDGVVAALREVLESPEGLIVYAHAYNKERQRLAREKAGSRAATAQELAKVSAELDRAIGLLVANVARPETLRPKIAELEARKTVLELDLQRTEPPAAITLHTGAVGIFRAQLDDLAGTMKEADRRSDSEPAQALRKLINNISVQDGYDLKIECDLAPLVVGESAGSGGPFRPPPPIPFVVRRAA